MSLQVDYETQVSIEKSMTPQRTARKAKIAFFGIFGIENLGNECTLQAILHNFRKIHPEAEIEVISFDPADTLARHQVRAIAVSQQDFSGVKRRNGIRGAIAKLLRLCRRVPGELMDWVYAIRSLRGTDVVFMTGTGMLTDYMTTASGFPYDVFRWTAAARLAGCKVRFVGVGVGPIYGRISRWLITTALSLADYRSFRDKNSSDRIQRNGFDSGKDPVYPDLAFGLPSELFPRRSDKGVTTRQVGLGVMDHRDIHLWSPEQHKAQYSAYLETMCDFIVWLLEQNYTVRILQGDARHDKATRAELRTRLEKRGIRYDGRRIIDDGCDTVEELVDQIVQADIVVSPRFHNLLLALMMNIPVISISYDPKNDCLLDGVGLGEFHQPLFELNFDKLKDQFRALEDRSGELKPVIANTADEYRKLLAQQFDRIFVTRNQH